MITKEKILWLLHGAPLWVREGQSVPRFYGLSHFAPVRDRMDDQTMEFHWERKAYPIPLNVIVAGYLRADWFFRRGAMFMLPAEYMRTKWFKVYRRCPNCNHDLESHPFTALAPIRGLGSKVHSGISLDRNEPKMYHEDDGKAQSTKGEGQESPHPNAGEHIGLSRGERYIGNS